MRPDKGYLLFDFDMLGLAPTLSEALKRNGFSEPTPIQNQAIPLALEGHDVLGLAQTGTGKTLAFGLPLIDGLLAQPGKPAPKTVKALVLAPTRELVNQIADSLRQLTDGTKLRVGTVVGGQSINRQINFLSRGTDILVATPGRLIDLMDRKAVDLSTVRQLVLDEADQMLDLGFIHALRRISQLVPEDRQTLFFSATMPKQIQELVGKYCHNPVKVSVTPESTTAERIDQFLFMVQQDEKQTLLEMILSERHPVPGKFERVLIFARTKHGCDRIVKKLSQSGIPANAIHGNKSQPQRERALGEFRSAKTPILVATDVAARGIDIPGVSHVLNYELPNVPEQYVHRIGRTARAGRDGIAIAFCAEDERDYLKDIRKKTDAEFERLALPDNFRAVVEGVGPTKREQKPRLARPKVRPAGDAARKPKPKQKHTARKGKPAGAGSGGTGAGAGRPGGNRNRSRNRRRSGGGAPRG